MFKKIIVLFLSVILSFVLSSCAGIENEQKTNTDVSEKETQTEDTIDNNQDNNFVSEESKNDLSNNSFHTHDYAEATCSLPKQCSCGATMGVALGHSLSTATCISPKKCNRCGMTVGTALGHNYSAADCTNPKICTRCQNVSGKALGHDYKVATCTTPKICTRCNNIADSALGHNYVNKKCTRCGKLDRTYLIEDINISSSGNYVYYNKNTTTDNYGNKYSGHYTIHADDCGINFNLAKKYSKLAGTIFLPEERSDTNYNSYIQIFGDGKLIYQSRMFTAGTAPENFEIDVSGISILRIYYNTGRGNINASSPWSVSYLTNAYLTK